MPIQLTDRLSQEKSEVGPVQIYWAGPFFINIAFDQDSAKMYTPFTMKTQLIKEILAMPAEGQNIEIQGWVRTKRETRNIAFIELNDGSCFRSIQLTIDLAKAENSALLTTLKKINTGAAIQATGQLVASVGSGQSSEVNVSKIQVLGTAPENYPLQKKRHSFEFLREIAHLRPRTNTFAAVARVRSHLSYAIHEFFHQHDFLYVHTPIITTSDAEGAGSMFQVTTLDVENLAKSGKEVDWAKDFFNKKAYLTVSGQLEGEAYATALSRIYTFGPTFRAENSNTSRHLSEFWMIEPEFSFARLEENMDLAEAFLKHLFSSLLDNCLEDLEFFDKHIQTGIIDTLRNICNSSFVRMSYTQAIAELEKSNVTFEFKPFWGCDLQSEHEKYLSEQVAKGPVIVYDYPKEIKAFYMKLNEDGKTVRAMDVLVPRLGEIIGGSEREENFDVLTERMKESGLDPEAYWWYLDLRKYGSVPHSGFGLGFERLIQYVTGMTNIRDVIPFPRAPGLADF